MHPFSSKKVIPVSSVPNSLEVLQRQYGDQFTILEMRQGLTTSQVALADYLRRRGALPDRRYQLPSFDSFSPLCSLDFLHPDRKLGVYRNGRVLYHLQPPDSFRDTVCISMRLDSSPQHHGPLVLPPDSIACLDHLITMIQRKLQRADRTFLAQERKNRLSLYADLRR